MYALLHAFIYIFFRSSLNSIQEEKESLLKDQSNCEHFKIFGYFFICIGLLPACMCMYHGTLCSRSPKLSVAYPGTGITDGCESACGC